MQMIYLDEKGIRAFLKLYGKGPNSKDYEFLMAILLKRFCELEYNQECCMAFKIKDKYASNSGFNLANIEEVNDVLRKQLDEDDSVDVAIARGTINNPEKKGVAFQLKRFGKNPEKNDTDSLIDYLNNEIPKKYTKTETSLFIALEANVKIDFKKVRNSLITDNYPFNSIRFIWMDSDKVYIGEIWPKFGMNEYDPHVLIREMYV